ncbi:centromere protein U [Plectropomus leopardus]|uniref:centromere protein U n=1 Tax=Plectropomus leopardus TaxID=160734 RepID=UPI001C4D165D|nr:centromere protein U [Plectropomus leopardus]
MSAKKGRRAEVLTVPQHESQKGVSMDSPNLSSIEAASFFEGLQQNHSNPLHSTALEEDLNASEEGQIKGEKAGKKEIPQKLKTTVKKPRAAMKRKDIERDGENGEEGEKKKKRNTVVTGARPVKNQQAMRGKKRKSEPENVKSRDPESKEESGSAQQRRKRVPSSEEEEEGNEDRSWNPSPKKAKMSSLGSTRKSSSEKSKSRKSSSGSASAEAEKADSDQQRRKRRGHRGGTESEVVLDAFLDFCDQYRESVESSAVQQSIDCFSSTVKDELLKKISSSKEFKVLKRENAKVGSSIRVKTQRLFDAKQELMRAERQVWSLQKDKAELKTRLNDLRRGQAFLNDIRKLNRQYLDHRHKHPKEKETYGASSLPALLLETKHIQAAEHQLRGINKR